MYSYFNPNPNGRNVSDCTVRAICKATGKDWGEAYLALCIQGYLDDDLDITVAPILYKIKLSFR